MALRDTSCYTLTVSPSPSDPNITELSEAGPSKSEPRYARVREKKEGEAYSSVIYDYLTGAKLGSVGYIAEKSKTRRLQLHGPDEDVPFDFSGKLNFEWTFVFQGNKFRWTRELYGKDYICTIDRKPDPKVEICLAREMDKNSPARLQILHYNIDRFPNEITDLRGLETLLVATLMCFLDAAEDRNGRPNPSPNSSSNTIPTATASSSKPTPPPVPPRIITPEDFEPENPNEIIVGTNTDIDGHVARAVHLLEDPHTLFIVIRTRDTAATQRALEVSLGVTRFRHREGMGDLHQYVVEEEEIKPLPPAPKGPKVIDLNDEPPKSSKTSKPETKPKWTPPKNISIYLSTIEIPDLNPSRRRASAGQTTITPLPKTTELKKTKSNEYQAAQAKYQNQSNSVSSSSATAVPGIGGSGGSGNGTVTNGSANGNGNGKLMKPNGEGKSKKESTLGRLFR